MDLDPQQEVADVADPRLSTGGTGDASDYDVAVVGASLAGSTAAIFLARAGARVVLIEQRPDPAAFKRICTHFIQGSAVATIERLGLLEPMLQAGALRTRPRGWTRWGWVESPSDPLVPSGINLRREILDPMARHMAAETPGVELILGHTAHALVREGRAIVGVDVRERGGESLRLRARLVVGADGRDSSVAELAGVRKRTIGLNRFAYGAYFEGPSPAGAPDGSAWFLDPEWAAAFPTDHGQTFYAAMPTKERLPEFRRDPAQALVELIAGLPDAPPIRASRMVGSMLGKIDMPNTAYEPTAPGLALVGDAALAIDPLWGVGCGWAFQTSEWLADSVAPALLGAESLEQGLERYSRRHARGLRGHRFFIHDYSSGRKFNPVERMLFSAASRDERVARTFEAFGSRSIGPARAFSVALPRAALVNARHALGSRRGSAPLPGGQTHGAGLEGA
jgi:2-polyprenyl-6-methoxyphenol hydroxylase-like FAD-dependent oxidoreductase